MLVYLSLGSNLGARRENCIRAIELLEERGVKVLRRSSMHETQPWGLRDQPSFINMSIAVETRLSPRELLALIQGIERELGRNRTVRWGPRSIDIDILLFDDLIVDEEGLIVPHPLMHEREFVLAPLSEIAPDKVHPVLSRKISELLAVLRSR